MKKLLVVVALVAVSLPVLAWSASPYVTSFTDGKYQGKINSVDPSINGKVATMEVKHEGDTVVGTVTYEGGKEIWKWNDKTLTQQEVDLKTNQPSQAYGATASAAPATNKQLFNVNCKNKAANDCDAGIDANNTWTLTSASNTINYTVNGKLKKGDAAAPVQKKHEFSFTKTN